MNNNRNNTNSNRRRGRGNNRPQGGGRGEQLNRIDSRARGNAPQLLEKFKKLASDAHLNGDRVTAEYYLQFADHYFRVIADARLRQEEQRVRRDERPGEGGSYSAQDEAEDGEFTGNDDFGGFDSPAYRREELRSEPRNEPREPREPREFRNDQRPPRHERPDDDRARENAQDEPEPDSAPADNAGPGFEPAGANPFTRDNRGTRGLRPRREPRPPRDDDGPGDNGTDRGGGIDPSLLPPAIAEGRDAAPSDDDAPAPRRRGRPRRAAGDDGNEPLEAVNG
ncbi:MAG TPA: DUF4167 domain-containing protein [Novosphingobium sp.]|nr:DUF4167 domain-containing protein [Novosphingobium sp.]